MSLVENSQDFLNMAKAISIVGISIFLIWFIYYLVMMMKQFYKIVKEMRERLIKIDEAIEAFKDKIEHGASYLALLGEGIKKVVEVAREHGKKKPKKKSKKK